MERTSITLRQPSRDEAELIVTCEGRSNVYWLSHDQVKLLLVQLATATANWPAST